MILAKPTGITLQEHTNNVISEAANYLAARAFVFDKCLLLTGIDLKCRVESICRYHDIGKKVKQWQEACLREYQEFCTTKKISGKHLAKANTRHEIHSVLICQQNKIIFSEEELVAIAAHHGKLSEQHVEKWEKWNGGAGKELWKMLKQMSNRSDKWDFEHCILTAYRYAVLRSVLQFADKRASAREDNHSILEYGHFDYHFNESWEKRPVQQIAEQNADKDLLLLRAPTGAGKTDAALLWAKQQICVLKRADRLVIALPTRFTSNALAINISDTVSEAGVYHSSSKLLSNQPSFVNHFAKLLETPVTVCTIDHLLIALSRTKEEHHQVFFNLANSCLVIDEADFYDQFTQANLLILLEALNTLRVPVLLMSASLPQSSLTLYQKAGYNLTTIYEDTSDNKRIRCNISNIVDYGSFDDISAILNETRNRPAIIYVNTVDKAIKLKRWFAENHPQLSTIVYHSRFTESDKAKKEVALIKALGRNAWEKNCANAVAILTQIGEMSVNISADFMISEICPIDRLVQRVGRLSRFKKQAGNLLVLKPIKDGLLYPAPYGNFNYGKWTMNESLERTVELLEEKGYSAFDFVELVNEVYKDGIAFSDKAVTNSKKLRDMIIHNWLILPNFELEEEKESGYWRTRYISEQITVLALTLDDIPEYLNSYLDFEILKNQYGINCPVYLVRKNLDQRRLIKKTVNILDNEENVILLSSMEMYNYEFGLDLSILDSTDQFL